MTLARYLLSALACLLVAASLLRTVLYARRTLLPDWSGPPARLAESVIGVAVVIGVSELLGAFGVFRVIPFVLVLTVIAGLTYVVDGRILRASTTVRPSAAARRDPPRQETWYEVVGALFAVALLGAEWAPGTIHSLSIGMDGVDTLWYHGPIAATFFQTGHVLPLVNVDNDNIIEFYPASSELVHAVGMLLLGSDVLSPLINLGWLVLALLSAWCIGRRFGVASIALVATAAVLGTTEIVGDEPGGGYDDIVGIALVLASIALLLSSDFLRTRSASLHGYWIAALAAGLAAGVKYTFLFPALGLTIAFGLMARSGARVRSIVQWCLIEVLGGGFWYARNLFYAGNPLPDAHIDLGITTLPSPPYAHAHDLLQFVLVSAYWREFFIGGLRQAFGPAWWVLLGLATAGLIGGLLADPRSWFETTVARAGRRRVAPHLLAARILAVVGIATLLGYLVTPQPLLPENFVYDARFALLAVLCGIIVLPVGLSKTRWMVVSLLGIFEATMIATQFASGIWSGSSNLVYYHSAFTSLGAGVVILSIGAVMIAGRHGGLLGGDGRVGGWPRRVAIVGAVALAVVGGFFLQSVYLRHRYEGVSATALDRWASSVHHARIGVFGPILTYPLYGSDLTNAVTFISTNGSWSAHYPITSCGAWREDINENHYQYVLVVSQIPPMKNVPSPARWMDGPMVHTAFVSIAFDFAGFERQTVFSVRGRMDPSACNRR
jgi:hypothetical protein